ncbi:MAG TPA: glucose-6-phosphate dehydrogenase [Hyphomicrobiales bacterium]|nr:glucose-6-phosphate dehydrogenase [Hyphomicrobiales bacterium]
MAGDGETAPPPKPRRPEPCSFVIFGASGDLTRRLLVPALYNLAAADLLPERFCLVGFSRQEMTDDQFRDRLKDGLKEFATAKVDPKVVDRLLACTCYVRGEANNPDDYATLRQRLEQLEDSSKTAGNRLFYLAVPPSIFLDTCRNIAKAGLTKEDGNAWRHVIVEKPFGTDLESAKKLNAALLRLLKEDQIFRIDHYLGKETVQNILILRFANGLFEPIWNRDHIDHVQITVAETVNVERRGRFYDAAGALRDMVPNHLFQLLSLVAMEPPARFDAGPVRSEKAEILEAIQLLDPAEALKDSVRAQYLGGQVNGSAVVPYREAPDVAPDSVTETFVALKLQIENWRWAGVPFYLRTGKAMARRRTEVAIKFKEAPFAMFRATEIDRLAQNFLTIGIQPEETIALQFNAKVPGPAMALEGVEMKFNYRDYFDAAPSTGYETLIYDCMIGDALLFQRADGVEAGWRAVQPFLDAWKAAGGKGLATYAAGSEGPEEAAALLARDGRRWRSLSR